MGHREGQSGEGGGMGGQTGGKQAVLERDDEDRLGVAATPKVPDRTQTPYKSPSTPKTEDQRGKGRSQETCG